MTRTNCLRSIELDRGSQLLSVSSALIASLFAICASALGATEPVVPDSRRDPKKDLEEVVVTAQRREEKLQDVPISISVLTGAELESPSVASARDALTMIPGIAINQQYTGSGTQVTVRGVTAGQGLFSGAAPVGYYLDSMPFGLVKSAIAPDLNAYDLERIEALRGPQGTLYGASALNGVIRVLTHDADLNGVELKARATVSSTKAGGDGYRTDVVANVPLIEGKLAARAVVGYEDSSGWIDTPIGKNTNDARLRNYRLKINAQPTDALSLRLAYWKTNDDLGAPNTAGDDDINPSRLFQGTKTGFDAYDLSVNYDFSSGYTLSNSTSYFDYNYDARIDFTNLLESVYSLFDIPFGIHTKLGSNILAEEVLLRSPNMGPWRWSVGGIYRRGSEDRLQTDLQTEELSTLVDNTSESWAIFGEVTRVLVKNRLEATIGVRHFEDHVTQDGLESQDSFSEPVLRSNQGKFRATTPRAVLSWHANQNVTIYGSYSQGFRSGFPREIGAPATIPDADPDKLSNYELGAKGSVWDRRLVFDAAVYFIDWRDVQTTIAVPVIDSNGLQVFTNATINGEAASGPGVDLSLTARPIDGLTLGLTASWNRLTMDAAVYSDGVPLWNKGDRLNMSPETTLGASTEYQFPLGAAGFHGRFSMAVTYTSEQEFRGTPGQPRVLLGNGDPITMGRVAASIDSPERWTVTLFVNNVTNEDGAVIRPFLTPALTSRIRPRTLGLQLDYHFQ